MKARGFTFIELMIVISITSLLALLTVAQVRFAKIRASNSVARSTIQEAGKAVELFKTANEAVPIVQSPQAPYLPIGQYVTYCFPTMRCYPAHAIMPAVTDAGGTLYQSYNNGFTSELFNGTPGSSIFFSLKVDAPSSTRYPYMYMSNDCSADAVPVDGHHKYSGSQDYLLLTWTLADGGGEPAQYYWIQNGSAGQAISSSSVPFPPSWNPAAITYSGQSYQANQCIPNYP